MEISQSLERISKLSSDIQDQIGSLQQALAELNALDHQLADLRAKVNTAILMGLSGLSTALLNSGGNGHRLPGENRPQSESIVSHIPVEEVK